MARPPEPETGLLRAEEVARRLGIGVRTLYRLVAAGIVPAPLRFNRRLIRWRPAEVEQYLAQLRQASGADGTSGTGVPPVRIPPTGTDP